MASEEQPGATNGGESHVEQIAADDSSSMRVLEPDHADVLPSKIGGLLSTDCKRPLNFLWRAYPLKNNMPLWQPLNIPPFEQEFGVIEVRFTVDYRYVRLGCENFGLTQMKSRVLPHVNISTARTHIC